MTRRSTNNNEDGAVATRREARRRAAPDHGVGRTRDGMPTLADGQMRGDTGAPLHAPVLAPLPTSQEALAALDRQKLAVTVEEAARLLSLNRTKVYALCMRGELRSLKIGRSRRIPIAALHEYLEVSA